MTYTEPSELTLDIVMPTARAKMLTTYNRHYECQNIAANFIEKYGEQLPEGLGSLGIGDSVSYNTSCTYRERQTVLSEMGRVFGTAGWTRHLNYNRSEWDWRARVDGVELWIGAAEPLENPRDGSQVSPNAFPLTITE